MTETDELPIEWFDGEFFPTTGSNGFVPGRDYPGESAMLIGTEGALLVVHRGGLALLPQDKLADFEMPKFPERNHYHPLCRCLPWRREDRIAFCPDRPDDGSHSAGYGSYPCARYLAGVGRRQPEIPQPSGCRKIPSEDVSERLGSGLI
ncbi:MAG: hypothetical protein U5K79_13600 [Cyclobacteriaceae bacterium]|nr:hypothetical protein [Cyclobacteriaceae bacterium]